MPADLRSAGICQNRLYKTTRGFYQSILYNNYMRFEVPQFIEIEDKIFGPFTWRQFVYLAGGVGMAVVIFLVAPLIIFILIGMPIGLLALALAFYPVNNRPFSIFLESVFRFYRGSRTYHWRRGGDVVYRNLSTDTTSIPGESVMRPEMSQDINSLSKKLELKAIQKDL